MVTEKTTPTMTVCAHSKFWYLNGKLHRADGPAVEWADGTKSWWLNDKLHRIDGPAFEDADGSKEWYLNNKRVTATDVFWAAAQEGNAEACNNIVEKYAEELSTCR